MRSSVLGPDADVVGTTVSMALAEDLGTGDVTTDGLIGPSVRCRAELLLKEPGVVCGGPFAAAVFRRLDPQIDFQALVAEGERLSAPGPIATVEGLARAVMTGERTALNLLGRMSGIATLTRSFVDAVAGTGVAVLDTRKTTPGLRALEKYATRTGGARNHRQGLYDAVLVKDNHLKLAGGVSAAVRALRATTAMPIEVEVESLDDVAQALDAGADALLLDNMSTDVMVQAVALTAGRAGLEASGGVSADNIRDIAGIGVDSISIGAITHSARSLDVSLEVL